MIFNTLWPKRNGRHFTYDIFKLIFFYENNAFLIWISSKYSHDINAKTINIAKFFSTIEVYQLQNVFISHNFKGILIFVKACSPKDHDPFWAVNS